VYHIGGDPSFFPTELWFLDPTKVCQEWRKKVRLATKAAKEKSMMSQRAAARASKLRTMRWRWVQQNPTNMGWYENKGPLLSNGVYMLKYHHVP